jgi:two-component system chemotaxis sensor kinase CheA
MIDNELLEMFREESQEQLAGLESSLLDLESVDDISTRRRIIDNAFRHAHNIKGSSRAVGLNELQGLGQQLEDTLDELREDPENASQEIIAKAIAEFDVLLAAYDRWEQEGGTENISAAVASAKQATSQAQVESQPASTLEESPAQSWIADDEILALFREESQEHVAALESSLLDLETTEDARTRRGIIDNTFRHAHSLKGAARAVGLTELQNLAQKLEDTLDEVREDPETMTRETTDRAIAEFDTLRKSYDRWEGDDSGSVSAPSKDAPTFTPSQAPPEKTARTAKASEDRSVVRVPAERLDRMLSLAGEVRVSQRGSDSLASQLSVLNEFVANTLADYKRFEEKLPRLAPDAAAPSVKEPVEQMRTQLEGTVERLRQLQSDFSKKRFREELLVEELEQDIRTARLVPLANLTDPMRRAVRDLVKSLGKSISYEPNVGDILLDKAVMESLKDPLMHLIRNAADHGIESPEARAAVGKPEEGTISITASRRAESVLIRISDDGGGIQFDRIRQKLKQEGGLDDTEIAAMSEKDLAKVLFQAGFTTKQQATEVSGRGVGMDVVLDAIHRLQGTVELDASSPVGTTFLITVPVTISTARILTVTSSGQRYGIPTASMVRTGRLPTEALRDLEGCLIVTVDGAPVRWIELAELLGTPAKPALVNGGPRAYLLLLHEGRKLALAVDEFEDEAEVILKSLEFPLAEVDELIGGTIRPDGSVQLVLDPSWLMSRALRVKRRVVPAEAKLSAQILVVDDSPTTRSILRNVLSAAGYAVQTAADGVEAVERLRTRPFDLVVSDVEMPRMNGFELARQVKARFGLPIILVTGLEKEEDRRQGLQAGADAYVVKSTFEDKGLLEIVKQFV